MMIKTKLAALFIYSVGSVVVASEALAVGDGEWRVYSQELNGDVYFYDTSRVKKDINIHRVWSRVRYKTSIMGASSYQSLVEIDCSERTERVMQNTFFSDKQWKKPAMKTDVSEKPKRLIINGSATERLSEILCNK